MSDIAFICSKDITEMTYDKVEDKPEGRERLKKFKEKVKGSQRNVSFWKDTGELVSRIKTAINTIRNETPVSGWVKCSELGISGSEDELSNIYELMKRGGMERIFRTRAEKNAESDRILEDHNIKILDGVAFGLRSFRTSREHDILECLNNGASIRLLVMDPNSQFVTQRAIEENDDPKSIAKSIMDLTDWVNNINAKSTRGSIKIKYYNAMTIDFYWRIDDKLYFGPYWYGTSSQQTITYKYIKGGLGFSLYSDYFERLWNDPNLTRCP